MCFIKPEKAGRWWPLILALERQRQVISEFKASLVYRASVKTTRTVTQRNPVLKHQNNNNKNQMWRAGEMAQ